MTTGAGHQALHFYPDRYFSASPTFNSWVKLTAAGVHALRAAPSTGASNAISRTDSFEPTHPTFYHLNHPIRFIRLLGTVVAIEDLAPRFALLTLDDGSGATVEVKITRLAADQVDATGTHGSNTTAAKVQVDSGIGVFDVLVDGARVDVGTVLKTKCTLATFRGVKQLALQRCWVVPGTAEEAAAWADTAAFMRNVLARPWVLGPEEMAAVDKRARREERRRREEDGRAGKRRADRERSKAEWMEARARKIKASDERAETRRAKEEVLMDMGALV